MEYIEPVFRPPSEGKSLILQVTNGCSWNKCTFCDMYTQPQKKFRVKPTTELEQELKSLAPYASKVQKVFLADGDAMTLSHRRLVEMLNLIRSHFPNLRRVSSYCLPRNLKNKSGEQLNELNELGLSLMYVGCESGDDEVLGYVEKGETFTSSLEALQKIKQAGMKSSVMILNGLGGEKFWQQHAKESARLMNAAQPEYLSTLVVSFPLGTERFAAGFNGQYQTPTQERLFQELELLLE
ncbi:MAG: radical SAM protein, partial [Pseudomonadales bacterium]|nr:radical SAM protein [Pseudomonadales bacterium]